MVNFTLKQLTCFSAVAEHGSIAQAARALNISQPAVAFALDKLEDMLELKLFTRQHARGMELTPEGREVLAVRPNITLSGERKNSTFKRQQDLDRYIEGLRMAGVPERSKTIRIVDQ